MSVKGNRELGTGNRSSRSGRLRFLAALGMTKAVIPSEARDRDRPERGARFPVPGSRFPFRSRLMLTGGLALGVTMMAAGIWVSRPIPPAMLTPSGGLGLTIDDRHGVPLRSTRAAD